MNSHIDLMIAWFKLRGGVVTLREILNSGEPWQHEFNARKTDLRKRTHYDLVLVRGKTKSDNAYSLIEKSYRQTEIAA